ncbi:universal stress protein [Actinomadura rupiterrae]|uniref:universal stress protein n=1 Tax=Actinomadura rupiterrae TaxID=559627 RepID=UPI0020A3C61B|nr:universal stress protein [Actinomadura rupiterrae]MCP2341678.1 nucleotide-binding universal stress UspA family protein [Actinomadura rupiterrae]
MGARTGAEGVVVGVDGSPASDGAVDWAVDEARRREVQLLVCHAWNWPYPDDERSAPARRVAEAMGALVLEDAVRLARKAGEDVAVDQALVRGSASGVLVAASRMAGLVVVGSRGRGGFDGLAAGSTALQVPAHTDHPVVVVPAHEGTGRTAARVVVGVDGSPDATAALRFGFREARLRKAALAVMCVWEDPALRPGIQWLPFTVPDALKRGARMRFETSATQMRADFAEVAMETRFVLGHPPRVLADASADADLLVVRARGLGAAPGMPLGPVTQAVLATGPARWRSSTPPGAGDRPPR